MPGRHIRGKPTVVGNTLYTALRPEGLVAACALTDPMKPVLRWEMDVRRSTFIPGSSCLAERSVLSRSGRCAFGAAFGVVLEGFVRSRSFLDH